MSHSERERKIAHCVDSLTWLQSPTLPLHYRPIVCTENDVSSSSSWFISPSQGTMLALSVCCCRNSSHQWAASSDFERTRGHRDGGERMRRHGERMKGGGGGGGGFMVRGWGMVMVVPVAVGSSGWCTLDFGLRFWRSCWYTSCSAEFSLYICIYKHTNTDTDTDRQTDTRTHARTHTNGTHLCHLTPAS